MKDIYTNLKIQRNEYKRTLQEKKAQLEVINTEKQNIVIKKFTESCIIMPNIEKKEKLKVNI